MELTVIGCAGSFPSAYSPCSSYLVSHDGFHVVLDLGNGSLGALQTRLDLRMVDAVVLSHLHPDHCVDLCAYHVVRRYHPDGAMPPIPVYGPEGAEERLGRVVGSVPDDHALGRSFDFRTLMPGVFELGPFRVEAARVNHSVETYAVRLSVAGKSLVYSADTGECDALVGLSTDADLLLCEASYLDGRDTAVGIHLTGRQAGEHARRAGVGRLILTHIPTWTGAGANLKAASAAYGGPTTLAVPGAVVTV